MLCIADLATVGVELLPRKSLLLPPSPHPHIHVHDLGLMEE